MEAAAMRKTFPALAFILALLLLAMAGTRLVNLGRANPYIYGGDVPSRSDTIPPKISIFSPSNNTVCNRNYVDLNFNVSAPTGPTVYSPIVNEIYYKTDWQQNNVTVYEYTSDPYSGKATNGEYAEFSSEIWRNLRPRTSNLNLTGVPEGNHNITIVAWYIGWYVPGDGPMTMNSFSIKSSSVVSFIIDTTPPSVAVLSVENKAYDTSNVPLKFTVNETASRISYVLDGQENVTTAGNTTLIGLSNGAYNVTVYAWDIAGNAGASETIYFSVEVPAPFPTTLVAASVVSVAVIGIGLLVFFKKYRRQCDSNDLNGDRVSNSSMVEKSMRFRELLEKIV